MKMNKKAFCKAFTVFVFLSAFPNWSYCQATGFSYSLNLTSLSFSGDGIVPIRDDNNTKFYDAPHWTTDEQKPVCFVSGTKPKIACLFQITGVCTNIIYVKGQASNGMVFMQQALTIQSNGAVYPLTESNSSFEQGKADLLKDFTIDWYMTNNPSGTWVKVATSKNVMYITKGNPKQIYSKYHVKMSKRSGDPNRIDDSNYPTYRTILHIGCEYGKGQTSDAIMVKNIYDYFKTKKVSSIENNHCMQYWGDTYGNGYTQLSIPIGILNSLFTSNGLLQYGEGTCNAWAVFFVEIMRSQGNDQLNLFVVKWKSNGFLDAQASTELANDLTNYNYTKNPFSGTLQASFFVKKWSIPNQTPFVIVDKSNYRIGGIIAEGDEDGLKGQCMDNPWSIFSDHVIVKYVNTYYDPSYGSDAVDDIAVWQGNSIAYFGTAVSIREKDSKARFAQHYWLKNININEVVNVTPVTY